MRVLFATTPAVGHVHPVIPFALAADAGGHDVAFATSPGMAGMVERSGFRCFPVGIDLLSQDEVDQQYPQMRAAQGKDRAALGWQNLFAGHYPKAVTGGLTELAKTWRPDIVVHDDVNFGACIAAERLGISYAAVQTVAFRPHLYALVHDQLDERRREVGLPADVDGMMPFRRPCRRKVHSGRQAGQALTIGTNVILDFGVWSKEERSALKAPTRASESECQLVYLPVEPAEQRLRLDARSASDPDSTCEITDEEVEFAAFFEVPNDDELTSREIDPPPVGFASWAAWIAERWPASTS